MEPVLKAMAERGRVLFGRKMHKYELAELAGVSETSLRRRFKGVTKSLDEDEDMIARVARVLLMDPSVVRECFEATAGAWRRRVAIATGSGVAA